MRWRILSSNDPDPQAKSNTVFSFFRWPVLGSWLSSVTMPDRMLEICCGV